jgi:hypothetical protein
MANTIAARPQARYQGHTIVGSGFHSGFFGGGWGGGRSLLGSMCGHGKHIAGLHLGGGTHPPPCETGIVTCIKHHNVNNKILREHSDSTKLVPENAISGSLKCKNFQGEHASRLR